MITKFLQSKASAISVELIQDAIQMVKKGEHEHYPSFSGGGAIILLSGALGQRMISLRVYRAEVRLLMTDEMGGCIFYGGYVLSLFPELFIAQEYHRVIQNVEHLINGWSALKGFPKFPSKFTGLKDKNGKDIYEGDILSCFGNNSEVVFENGCFCTKTHQLIQHIEPIGWCVNRNEISRFNNSFEIIGNIYQNSDLLS